MMAAFTADRGVVTAADVASAVEELRWVPYSARPHQHAADAADAADVAPPVPPAVAHPDDSRALPPSLGHLLVATDGRTVQEVTLRLGRLIIGRTPDNDVQIDSRFISRHHCQVITTVNASVIEDLNSTNGIYVKSNRVRRHYLNDGDVVLVGKHELIYVDERAPRSRSPHVDTIPDVSARAAQEAAQEAARQAAPAAPAAEADEDAAAPSA